MKKLELFYPLHPSRTTQSFGQNFNPLYKELGMLGHNGIDSVRGLNYATDGANVRAAHNGVVVYAGIDSSGGYGVVVRTNELFEYEGGEAYFKTIYWHLKPNIAVRVGQKVEVGDVLGYADTTGRATAPHLHFGLKPVAQGENEWTWMNLEQNNGYYGSIDPAPYLSHRSAYEQVSLLRGLQQQLARISFLIGLLIAKYHGN